MLQMLEKLAKSDAEKCRPSVATVSPGTEEEGPAEDLANRKRSPNCCVLLLPYDSSAQTVSLKAFPA
ncbi:hypothetical protein ACNKHM_04625 [Shigella sonnei]